MVLETTNPITIQDLNSYLIRDIVFLNDKTYLIYFLKGKPPF
jgi:hypothetical protein